MIADAPYLFTDDVRDVCDDSHFGVHYPPDATPIRDQSERPNSPSKYEYIQRVVHSPGWYNISLSLAHLLAAHRVYSTPTPVLQTITIVRLRDNSQLCNCFRTHSSYHGSHSSRGVAQLWPKLSTSFPRKAVTNIACDNYTGPSNLNGQFSLHRFPPCYVLMSG